MKAINTFLSLICVFLVCSCDYLNKEPDTELTMDMVFQKRSTMEGWLANVYSGVPDPNYPYLKTVGWETLGDDMSPSEKYQQWAWALIPCAMGNWSPSTKWPEDYWGRFPKLIRSAYIFRENAYALPDQGITETDMQNMKGECRFLADYYFYLLLNTYGPIPFKPNYISPVDAKLSDLMEGQMPYDEIVDWLDKDLLAVSQELPATQTDSKKYGRATALAALAVRGRMLLFAASPLVNGNPDYVGHKNNKGIELFNSTYMPEKWERAAKACKELIDAAEGAGAELYYERNKNGSIDPFKSCQNAMLATMDRNKEILFARPNNDGTTWDRYCLPSGPGCGGTGGVSLTQSLVDAFFDRTGLPIDHENSVYVEDGFSTEDIVYDNTEWESRVKGRITSKGTYNMYCNREPRFYVDVFYNHSYFANGNRFLDFFFKHSDNNGTHDAPQAGYLNRKKTHPDSNPKAKKYPYRPGIIFRLAEAYLNYAEALNEWRDDRVSRKEALDYVNKVRERAGIRKYTLDAVSVNDPSFIQIEDNQTAVRQAVRRERRVELCCEGIRYDDLRRWKEAEKTLNGEFYGMNFHGTNNASFYQRVSYQSPRVFRKSFYWFPIYQDEIDKNSNLVQGPYWNNNL